MLGGNLGSLLYGDVSVMSFKINMFTNGGEIKFVWNLEYFFFLLREDVESNRYSKCFFFLDY